MGDTAGWAAFLDCLESELLGIERTPQGHGRAAPFLPPTGIGDLPGPLAERAREVLARIEASVEAVDAEMSRVATQLDECRKLDTRAPLAPSRVDTHL